MTTMVAEVYEAFISVGVKAEKAKAAAIALSSEAKSESRQIKTDLKEIVEEINTRTLKIEKDIQRIEKNIYRIEKELAILRWMVGGFGGIILILCFTILVKLFVG